MLLFSICFILLCLFFLTIFNLGTELYVGCFFLLFFALLYMFIYKQYNTYIAYKTYMVYYQVNRTLKVLRLVMFYRLSLLTMCYFTFIDVIVFNYSVLKNINILLSDIYSSIINLYKLIYFVNMVQENKLNLNKTYIYNIAEQSHRENLKTIDVDSYITDKVMIQEPEMDQVALRKLANIAVHLLYEFKHLVKGTEQEKDIANI